MLQRAEQKALDAREGRIEIEVAAGEGAAEAEERIEEPRHRLIAASDPADEGAAGFRFLGR